MTIANSVFAKASVAFVALATAFVLAAPAQAQTTAELEAQIAELQALIEGLTGSLGSGSMMGGSNSSVCPYTWTRSLNTGATGADVMKLQQFLNSSEDTRVAAAGSVGSAGMETEYYGPATGAAVAKFQSKFRAEILSPLGLVNATTYFGPSTMGHANALCVSAPVVVDDVDDDANDDDDEVEDMSLQGEGTLTKFEVDDDEDEVAEDTTEVVMILTLEAEDGDVLLSRLTFELDGTGNDEEDPWDTFEEITLSVDGEEIASFEADDEDNYLDEDAGEFRFSNIGLVLREDKDVEIEVAVTAQGAVDGSDVPGDADWVLTVTQVRTFDADGVSDTSDDVDEMGDSESFAVVEEGTDDGADVESSSKNPDAATLLVDEDSDDSDEFTVHIFDIEVDNDSGDLEVGDAFVDVTITNEAAAAAITGGQEDVIDGIFMTIDGETVEGEGTTGAADLEDDAIPATGGATVVRYLFEFDQDVVLEGDTDYEVEITIVFRGQDGEYVNGVTVETDVDGSLWEVEGAANDDELAGTDSSELHTLATVVPVISGTSFEVDRNEAGDAGTISFEFKVEADGENDVDLVFGDVDAVDGGADSIRYTISGGDGGTFATGTIAKISGDATVNGTTGWTIADGDDATFVLDVVFDAASAAGAYRVFIDTIGGVEIDETSGALNI